MPGQPSVYCFPDFVYVSTSGEDFTTQTTGTPSIEQMISCQPDYWIDSDAGNISKQKKVLILNDWSRRLWPIEFRFKVYFCFQAMLKENFVIYIGKAASPCHINDFCAHDLMLKSDSVTYKDEELYRHVAQYGFARDQVQIMGYLHIQELITTFYNEPEYQLKHLFPVELYRNSRAVERPAPDPNRLYAKTRFEPETDHLYVQYMMQYKYQYCVLTEESFEQDIRLLQEHPITSVQLKFYTQSQQKNILGFVSQPKIKSLILECSDIISFGDFTQMASAKQSLSLINVSLGKPEGHNSVQQAFAHLQHLRIENGNIPTQNVLTITVHDKKYFESFLTY